MSRRTNVIAAALFVLALGSPLITACADQGRIYFEQGLEKFDSGNYQGAIDDYTKAIEINPKYDLAYSNRGVARVKLGDTQGAIADYNKAIEINPQDAAHYYKRGTAKELVGDLEGACADWEEASSLLGTEDATWGEMYQC